MTRWIKYVLVLAIAAGALLIAARFWRGDGDPAVDAPVFAARRGPLTISVTESGTINHREKIVIKSKVRGDTTILFLIEEGSKVDKGVLLVQLDASDLEEKKLQQKITLLNAEANFIHARESLEVTRNLNASDIAKARLELKFARADLEKYLKGEYPAELQEAEAKITIAREEFSRAVDKLEWSKKLEKEGYINRSERQADELAAKKTALDVELTEKKLDLLKTYTHPRKLEELQSNIEQAANTLERTERIAKANLLRAETDEQARESEMRQQQDKLKELDEQIANCRITAPVEGEVIYATTAKMNWRSNREPLQEGLEVHEGMELIHLPMTASMLAEIKVHESSLLKVRAGLPVRVRVDALPDRTYLGVVGKISPLPDAVSVWLNPDLKLYSTEVYLEGDTTGLRPGMTCRAEIIVEEFEEALFVPVQSVVRVKGSTVVYVAKAGDDVRRKVQTGLDNSRMIHIIEGLSEGETVLLNPPLAASTAPQEPLSVKPAAQKSQQGVRE